jgi:hypothetical protein
MKSYPISTDRDYYRGSNASKQRNATEYNRVAARVEKYINDDLKDKPTDTAYTYFSQYIAHELGEDSSLVQRIVFSIDCGHNGVTIFKGDYEKALTNPRC